MSQPFYPQEVVSCHLISEEDIKTQPRYVSKFKQAVVLESNLNKDSKRTMGPAKVEAPCPDKYLKKHSKEPKLSEKAECSKPICNAHTCTCVRKPPVPMRTDKSPMGIHTKRNFEKTTVSVPGKPEPTSVDSYRGHKQLLENSGLVPKYIFKKDYGEVPVYLQQFRKEEQNAQEEYKCFVEEQKKQAAMQRLSDEERQAVLQSLKKKWDEVHGLYQKLPVIINTLLMKNRKIQLEEELSQLEKDIRLFERFTNIYISKN